MEQSTALNKSLNSAAWYEFDSQNESKNELLISIIDNSIKKYSTCLDKDINDSESKEDKNTIKLDLPNLDSYFEIPSPKKFSKKVQKWKGVVDKVNEDSFTANVFDLSDDTTYEYGEFDINEISPDDLKLLDNGSIFYWTVGYFMDNGQISKKSEIRFQRLIELSEEDINEANDNIENFFGNLLS
ncbi:hypothetical protein [Flavobacterium beibuense]|uniref:Uncharacterized protein n=1 Tax=Flavobacterium beibuense TaxID=657326 RepID=A0A444WFF7_9FLAO|nr:hypothetical protein [Flavobacterium beibuense]RYJ44522.1 hypothetical protein NU09_1132 [Flavobacterium beibuense]